MKLHFAGVGLQEWLERLIYVLVSVVVPLAIIVAAAFVNFGGILLIILLTVWMGFALVIFSPFMV